MGILGAFGSLTRDFIQYILPTIIGMALFVPFFVPPGYNLSVDVAILLSFILGYVIHLPIYDLATRLHDLLPVRSLDLKPLKEQRRWWARNWDYDALWVRLDKDEREYLYMTAAYVVFSQIAAMYFLIYSLVNVALLFGAVLNAQATSIAQVSQSLLAARTPLLGGWALPTLLVLPIALVLTRYLYLNVIGEYDILYGEEGFLVLFAGKVQQEKGGIARSIWGRVSFEGQPGYPREAMQPPLTAVLVRLAGPDGCSLAVVETNESGYFQMPGIYQSCLGKRCRLQIDDPNWEGTLKVIPTEKVIPAFEVPARRRVIPGKTRPTPAAADRT